MVAHKAVTIKDVALAAKVSRATAARALNGYGYVGEEAAERVQEAARQLGYRGTVSYTHLDVYKRQAFSLRLVGDDARYVERPGRTSPPYPGHEMQPGQVLREDWFPVLRQG